MPVIQILDKSVAELIAAGEVVERPASIAKELIENCIDAGATSVTVEIQDGGIGLLRVQDNGIGIHRDDVPQAFLRHATSKIRDAQDLDSILTLGFRGEALASIAAMAKVELTTKTKEEQEGTTCRIEGGQLLEIIPAGCPVGTTITVRDVFYNTPARMKFLKKNTSEGSAVAQVVDKCALSHPEIAFRFIRDGQTKLQTSGSGDLLSVIGAVYGRDMAAQMTPVEYVLDGVIGVSGYISKPEGVKPSRTYQNFFINGRYVKTRTAMAALEEAYKNKMMGGRFPACVLNLEIDAATVDVNVHPAKIEVRFAQEKPIFSAVYFAAKTALAKLEVPVVAPSAPEPTYREPAVSHAKMERQETPMTNPQQERMSAQEFRVLFAEEEEKKAWNFSQPQSLGIYKEPESAYGYRATPRKSLDIYVEELEPSRQETIFSDKIQLDTNATIEHTAAYSPNIPLGETAGDSPMIQRPGEQSQMALEEPPPYSVIGELFDTYILLQSEQSMILVDKHAAHERMLYEQLKEDISYGNRQLLLASQTVTLPQEDYAALVEDLSILGTLGFLVEDFGDGTVIVREIPTQLSQGDISFIIGEIADKVKNSRLDLTPHVLDRLYYSIACKSAVRAGDKNSLPELEEIIEKLRKNPQITHCPHGRPVSVELTRHDIEKLFGRLG